MRFYKANKKHHICDALTIPEQYTVFIFPRAGYLIEEVLDQQADAEVVEVAVLQ